MKQPHAMTGPSQKVWAALGQGTRFWGLSQCMVVLYQQDSENTVTLENTDPAFRRGLHA